MCTVYYAKSPDKSGHQTTNKMHLEAAAELARTFGTEINMPLTAWISGWLHDFGKYSRSFQNVLNGTASNIDHAICAAVYLYGKILQKRPRPAYEAVAAVTAAHHSALRSYASMRPELSELFNGTGRGICGSGKQSALLGPADYTAAERAFLQDFPGFTFKKLEQHPDDSPGEKMLRLRMLFSCLVDADYTVSADTPPQTGGALNAAELLQRLYEHMANLRRQSSANQALNRLRDQVFRQCGAAGELSPGVFTLTAPTGVGKTFSLLHFALRHCAAHNKRRVILVLPFLTLTEQSLSEYSKLTPHILSDHSQSRVSEEQQDLAARWDAPFIITTSVRFFESLFADRPKDCRKLHNIAQSVILFDEAQSLPPELAAVTMQSVASLCRDYGCTMVFSTATQPDFAALPELEHWHPREILPDGRQYYAALRRTQVQWRLSRAAPLEEIAQEMAGHESVCAIVNLRRHAVQLFEALSANCRETESDSLFFLTTDLCPAHRSRIIDTIKSRISNHLPCRVVATQCIEAGVDLDFEVMYRALAPLEAIIQAAGRCNRNGIFPDGGQVIVFIPEDKRNIYPGASYQKGAEIVKIMCAAGDLDLHKPDTIAEYYQRLFHTTKGRAELTKAIRAEDYEAVASEYQLIRRQGVQVIVPYQKDLFQQICQQAGSEGLTAALIRKAAPITVSSYNEDLVRQHCEQIPWHRNRTASAAESDFYILAAGHETCYQPDLGLRFFTPGINDEFFLV